MTRRRRTLVIVGLSGVVGLACFCVAVGVWAVLRGRAPEVVVWDFSKDLSVQRVAWPRDVAGDMYARYGDFDLRIEWSTGKVIRGRAYFVAVERNGAEVKQITAHFSQFSTSDEVYTHARRIMTDWRFLQSEIDRLEKWHNYVKTSTEPRGGGPKFHGPFILQLETTEDIAKGEDRTWSFVVLLEANRGRLKTIEPAAGMGN